MKLHVLYFASLREARGAASDIIELAAPAHVAELLAALRAGPLSKIDEALFTRVLVAVNQTVVGSDQVVAAGDEVALFPPMTGG